MKMIVDLDFEKKDLGPFEKADIIPKFTVKSKKTIFDQLSGANLKYD